MFHRRMIEKEGIWRRAVSSHLEPGGGLKVTNLGGAAKVFREGITAVCKGVVPDASRPHVTEPPLLKIGSKALIIYNYIYNL